MPDPLKSAEKVCRVTSNLTVATVKMATTNYGEYRFGRDRQFPLGYVGLPA